MMRQLYERATAQGAESCTWVEFENAGHMDAYEVAKEVGIFDVSTILALCIGMVIS